jgi:hypothetical protein
MRTRIAYLAAVAATFAALTVAPVLAYLRPGH